MSLTITHLQKFIVCLEMAIVLNDFAGDIGTVDPKQSDLHSIGENCRNIDSRCALLSGKLSLPLTLLHLGFFQGLVAEVPVVVVRWHWNVYSIYKALMTVKRFIELMIVVNAGNNIKRASNHLIRELRKRNDFLGESIREAQLFTKSEHAINFGVGYRLTHRSACCFLGLSWGFTLTMYQLSYDSQSNKRS